MNKFKVKVYNWSAPWNMFLLLQLECNVKLFILRIAPRLFAWTSWSKLIGCLSQEYQVSYACECSLSPIVVDTWALPLLDGLFVKYFAIFLHYFFGVTGNQFPQRQFSNFSHLSSGKELCNLPLKDGSC